MVASCCLLHLINTNANFLTQSDELVEHIAFTQADVVFQFFLDCDNYEKLTMVLAKMVADVPISREPNSSENVIFSVTESLKLGTITYGSGQMSYFALNIVQHDDMGTVNDGDEKLTALKT